MIRLLKRLADWLDARFPAKVVVTARWVENIDSRLDAYNNRIDIHSQVIADYEGRIARLEKAIATMKENLVKGDITPKAEADNLRNRFVQDPQRFHQEVTLGGK